MIVCEPELDQPDFYRSPILTDLAKFEARSASRYSTGCPMPGQFVELLPLSRAELALDGRA